MKRAAFFDLDNTVVRGSSLYPLGIKLLRSGLISSIELMRFASLNRSLIKTRTESLGGRDFVVARALSLVAGQRVEAMQALCEEVVPNIVKKRGNPEVIREIHIAHAEGYETWLVTASPIELAQRVAIELGMTGALGTRALTVGGYYTGTLDGPVLHGAHKALAASSLAHMRDLDLVGSTAMSDSLNDLPLLSLVGFPTVVNANKQLRITARSKGWRILEESPRRIPQPSPA